MVFKNEKQITENPNSTKINIGDSNIKIVNYIPHRRWRWVVLFSTIIIKIITSGTFSSFGFFIKTFIKEFQSSESIMSWMLSLNSCIGVVVAPLATYLALKFGHRMIVLSGLIIAGISFAAPYLYPHLWFVFLTGSVVHAIGQGLVNTCSTILLTTYFENHLPLILGIHACSSGLAPFIVSPFVRFLLHSYGWELTRVIYGSIYLVGAVFALTFKPVKHNSWNDNHQKFHLNIDKSKPDIQFMEIMKENETRINNHFSSQCDRICTFISTANIASTIAKKSEISNCYSSNISVHFTRSIPDTGHTNKVVNESEKSLNNHFGSQCDRICTFISTANIASTIARKSETSNCFSSNISVHFANSLADIGHANKDLVNININTLMGMSVASNLHMKSLLKQISMVDLDASPSEKITKNEENYAKENTCKSLFKNPIFMLFLLANLFTNLGYDTNFIYSKSKALEEGISDINSLFLPMCMGFGTIIGRLLFGYLGSQQSTNIYKLFTTCLILSGCSSLFSLLALSFPLMLTYSMLFGIFIGGFLSLNTAVLSSVISIYNFDSCLRIIYIVQAVGLLFGAPISGYLYDATKSFRWSLLTSGVLIFISGIILPIAYLSNQIKENQNKEIQIEEI